MERLAKIGAPGFNRGKLPRFTPQPRTSSDAPPFNKAVVFGANGGIGRALVKDLTERGVHTRVVSRSSQHLRRNFADGVIEHYPADIRNPTAAIKASEGFDIIFLCAGLPLHKYEDHVLIARSVAHAMTLNEVKCLCTSGYWSYMPFTLNPVPEDTPRRPTSRLAMLRQIQEDILVSAGGCVAMLPDFFGPGATHSMLNDAILSVAKGNTAYWPGDPDALRDFLFIPDAGHALVDLATKREAFARRVNLVGSGPIQPRLLLEAAAQRLGQSLTLRGVPLWAVKLAGNFSRKHREFADIYSIYNAPAWMDGSVAKSLIGDYHKTAYPSAIDRTARWLTGRAELVAAA